MFHLRKEDNCIYIFMKEKREIDKISNFLSDASLSYFLLPQQVAQLGGTVKYTDYISAEG